MAGSSVKIIRKVKRTTREEWENVDKSDLIDHILRLELRNLQLKNLLKKKSVQPEKCEQSDDDAPSTSKKSKPPKKKFDFSKSHKRHVLLKFLYFGWDCHGYADQLDSDNTIENHLFEALIRTCLIESRESSNYHRCGRTDKTVSAFSQVISIDLRSKLLPEQQFITEFLRAEIDYCGVLNRILPKHIQCIAWMPLRNSTFSARFNCDSRTYRYYFPRGSLNIDAMRDACKLLERHTDFRNFCKMDVQNGVINFVRNVYRATINVCENEKDEITDYTMFYLEITANAFLLRQIRCIMTVLLLVGQRKEDVNVVNELLDIKKNPCKPQYSPALGEPLNLFQTEFNVVEEHSQSSSSKSKETEWVYNREAFVKLIEDLQGLWASSCIRTTMIRDVIDHLLKSSKKLKISAPRAQAYILQEAKQPRRYQNLLNRKRCQSLEERLETLKKKQRLYIRTDTEST